MKTFIIRLNKSAHLCKAYLSTSQYATNDIYVNLYVYLWFIRLNKPPVESKVIFIKQYDIDIIYMYVF